MLVTYTPHHHMMLKRTQWCIKVRLYLIIAKTKYFSSILISPNWRRKHECRPCSSDFISTCHLNKYQMLENDVFRIRSSFHRERERDPFSVFITSFTADSVMTLSCVFPLVLKRTNRALIMQLTTTTERSKEREREGGGVSTSMRRHAKWPVLPFITSHSLTVRPSNSPFAKP